MNIDFSTLLIQLMNSENRNIKKCHEMLKSKGVNVSYPAFYSYTKLKSVPPFTKAKSILSAFDYQISDSDLQDILNYSKDLLRLQNDSDQKYIQRSIRMNPEFYKKNMNSTELLICLKNRVNDLYNADNFNQYINELIKKDLYENGYLRKE